MSSPSPPPPCPLGSLSSLTGSGARDWAQVPEQVLAAPHVQAHLNREPLTTKLFPRLDVLIWLLGASGLSRPDLRVTHSYYT